MEASSSSVLDGGAHQNLLQASTNPAGWIKDSFPLLSSFIAFSPVYSDMLVTGPIIFPFVLYLLHTVLRIVNIENMASLN